MLPSAKRAQAGALAGSARNAKAASLRRSDARRAGVEMQPARDLRRARERRVEPERRLVVEQRQRDRARRRATAAAAARERCASDLMLPGRAIASITGERPPARRARDRQMPARSFILSAHQGEEIDARRGGLLARLRALAREPLADRRHDVLLDRGARRRRIATAHRRSRRAAPSRGRARARRKTRSRRLRAARRRA